MKKTTGGQMEMMKPKVEVVEVERLPAELEKGGFTEWLEASLDELGLDGRLFARCVHSILRQTAPDPLELDLSLEEEHLPANQGGGDIHLDTVGKGGRSTTDSGNISDYGEDTVTSGFEGKKKALLDCLKSGDVNQKELAKFVGEILAKYERVNRKGSFEGGARPNDSIDSGVCPSPASEYPMVGGPNANSYDQAFPPLAVDELGRPRILVLPKHDDSLKTETGSIKSEATTIQSARQRTQPIKVPAGAARGAPFTREWTARSAELLTRVAASVVQQHGQPQFVVPKCPNVGSGKLVGSAPQASFTVGSYGSVGSGGSMLCPSPLAFLPPFSDVSNCDLSLDSATVGSQPRFMVHHVEDAQMTQRRRRHCLSFSSTGGGSQQHRRPAGTTRHRQCSAATTTEDDGTVRKTETLIDGSRRTETLSTGALTTEDYFESVESAAVQMLYQQQYDAERVVPSPVGNDPSGFCAPKVYGMTSGQYKHPLVAGDGMVPVSPTTHFVPIREDEPSVNTGASSFDYNGCVYYGTMEEEIQPPPMGTVYFHQPTAVPPASPYSQASSDGQPLLHRPAPVRQHDSAAFSFDSEAAADDSGWSNGRSAFDGVWQTTIGEGRTASTEVIWQPPKNRSALSSLGGGLDETSGDLITVEEDGEWPPEAPWKETAEVDDAASKKPRTSLAESLKEEEEDDNFLRYVSNIALRSPMEKDQIVP